MASPYKLIICVSGFILLLFLSLLSFAGYESLRINPERQSTSGLNLLLSALVSTNYIILLFTLFYFTLDLRSLWSLAILQVRI